MRNLLRRALRPHAVCLGVPVLAGGALVSATGAAGETLRVNANGTATVDDLSDDTRCQ